MSTFEAAGNAMLQGHYASRGLAFSIARALSAVFSAPAILPSDRTLSGTSFIEQEPGLAKESHDYIRSF